jgi:hypothetical protein
METKRSWQAAVFAVLLVITLAQINEGCAKRVPMTQAQAVTLNLNQALAAISTTNQAVATGVIGLNKSGLVKNDLTNSILNYSRLVAQSVITAENIQKGSLSDADKAAAVKSALAPLKLPADVSALLASQQTDAGVAGLITTINSLQTLIGALTGGR